MHEYQVMLDSVGQRIKYSIENSGLSQAAIADECGVSKQAITGWIKNSSISKKNLLCFSKTTGFSYEWILTGTGNEAYKDDIQEVKESSAPYSKDDVELLAQIKKLSETDRARLSGIIDALNPQLDKEAN